QQVDLGALTAVYLGDAVNAPSGARVAGFSPSKISTSTPTTPAQTTGISAFPGGTSSQNNIVFSAVANASNPGVQYQAQANGFQVQLSSNGASFVLGTGPNTTAVPLTFGGAAQPAMLTPSKPTASGFGEVDYSNVYQGIGLSFYGNAQGQLE